MPSPRFFLALVFAFLWVTTAGCASAGPDLRGPDGPSIMAAFSGSWTLDRASSDDLSLEFRRLMDEGRPGGMAGGGMPGGGRGGMPGGGGRRPGGGMPRGEMDSGEMMRSMEALRSFARPPDHISLELQPETVNLSGDDMDPLLVPFGSEAEQVTQNGVTLNATADWTKDGIEVYRQMQRGQGVRDRYQLGQDGRLLLKREIMLMGRSAKATLVYLKTP